MKSGKTIGIIGGGQLGRMLTLAAKTLGFKVVVIDPGANCPASQVGAEQIVGDPYDPATIKELASHADIITIEIEHLDTKTLEDLENTGVKVSPSAKTIKLIQDKYLQKKKLFESGIPVAPFVEITDEASACDALDNFGGKMLIKTRHGAYDGRGNIVIESESTIKDALELFKGKELYAETFIPFEKELAVIIARDVSGNIVTYPTVQTIHERNICVEVLSPAPISEELRNKAEKIAHEVANVLEGAGVFAIEMFLTDNNEILVNEIAPRVHNSGHQTIEANVTSQFEQHVRAISEMPLGDTSMRVPAAVMINILGERNGETNLTGVENISDKEFVFVHDYGKSPTKIDRKMGHITAIGDSIEQAKKRAEDARKVINI